MANTSAPFGFRQYRGTGSAPTYEQVTALVNYNTAAIFNGDPVFRLSDGTVAGATTGPGPGTGVIAGILIGAKYLSVATGRTNWTNYWPGSDVATGTTAEAYVINDPNVQFQVQAGNSTTVGFVQADIGLNAQFGYGTGTTANGISGAYIDMNVARATTSTFPFRVIAILSSLTGNVNTAAGAYNIGVVAFNNVETKSLSAQN